VEGLPSPGRGTAAVDPVAGRGFLVTQIPTREGEKKIILPSPVLYRKKTQEEIYESIK
jgi:hypothetical protein